MTLPIDYCPFCCMWHVTCECPYEEETDRGYWARMKRKEKEYEAGTSTKEE